MNQGMSKSDKTELGAYWDADNTKIEERIAAAVKLARKHGIDEEEFQALMSKAIYRCDQSLTCRPMASEQILDEEFEPLWGQISGWNQLGKHKPITHSIKADVREIFKLMVRCISTHHITIIPSQAYTERLFKPDQSLRPRNQAQKR